MNRGKAKALRRIIEQASVSLPDETALKAVELFPAWSGEGVSYAADTRLRYNGRLYRVVQAHVSQSGWSPDVTPALFTEVAKPGEIPVWRQPVGSQDAYSAGDKVHYPDADGPVWVSTVDDNVWEPGVYGWAET